MLVKNFTNEFLLWKWSQSVNNWFKEKKIKLWYQQITLLSTRISEYSVNVSMEVRAVEQYNFIHISVQFSRSVESDSLRPHEPQHARPPGPSTTPGVYPNPCPLSRWCHLTISSSLVPFSSWPQSFPESGSFQMSQLFASGSQSIGVSASRSPWIIWTWCLLLESNMLSNWCPLAFLFLSVFVQLTFFHNEVFIVLLMRNIIMSMFILNFEVHNSKTNNAVIQWPI